VGKKETRLLMITTHSFEGRYWQDIAIDFRNRPEILALMSLNGCDSPKWAGDNSHIAYFGSTRGAKFKFFHLLSKCRDAVNFGPNVIQTHLFYGGIFGICIGRILRIPVVVTRHHIDEHFIVGTSLHRYLDRLIIRLADAVIVRSSAAREWLILNEKGDPKKIFIVNQGFDFCLLEVSQTEISRVRSELNLVETDFNVLCVARYSQAKGQEYLLKAASLLKTKIPNLRLIFVGPGDSKWLEDLAKELNNTQKIDIFTSRNDIPACLAASDLVVHPSLVDSFSQLLIEVQAVGTAVVATDIAAARQQIIEGVTGLIVKPKDSQELAEAIFRVYKDPELRNSMGIAGFQHVRKQFQVKKMVDEDLMVVQLVLDYK
jgi:glycosyltransferase involved in cell wall biosynthesis